MRETDLLSALQAHSVGGTYPFHMPGHKRNTELLGDALPYALDITEIDGFDDLHAPDGILKDLNDRLSVLYGTKQSFALAVNDICCCLLPRNPMLCGSCLGNPKPAFLSTMPCPMHLS